MLKIDNLCKSYGNRVVLEHLNLHIKSGEIYALLGPNGAGKTTTINILCNLLQPDRGSITLNDQNLSQNTKVLLGVAPQENLLYRSLSCEENLNFFAKIYGLNSIDRKQRVQFSLEAVNLLDRAKSPVETLSGGMQRRLNIAVALVHNPKVLILDEPTTGLDIESRQEIWDLIKKLQTENMTILLTTHLLDEAEKICDRIGILKHGRIAAEGTLDVLKTLIRAAEILVVQTPEEGRLIARAQKCGFTPRRYGGDLTFWVPEYLELREILFRFEGITIDSISRHPVKLEHIYLEITQER